LAKPQRAANCRKNTPAERIAWQGFSQAGNHGKLAHVAAGQSVAGSHHGRVPSWQYPPLGIYLLVTPNNQTPPE
jgi:hypothetical protein